MKTGTIKRFSSAATGAVTLTSGQASPEVPSHKPSEFAGWPLSWWTQATTDLLRSWGQFSQFGFQFTADRRSAKAATLATQAPVARAEVGPPTSGDRLFHATMGRYTAGVSPASLGLAYADWALHLAASPGKWQQLVEKVVRKAVRLTTYAAQACGDPDCPCCIEPLPQDHRSAPKPGNVGRST